MTKGCALSPCSMPEIHGNDDEKDECEREKYNDSYTCNVCCRRNECNFANLYKISLSLFLVNLSMIHLY